MEKNMLQKNDDGVFHIYEKLKEPLSLFFGLSTAMIHRSSLRHPFVFRKTCSKVVGRDDQDILVGG